MELSNRQNKLFIPSRLQTIKITKRSILSLIARLFDPLGFIGPVLVSAKIMLQKLWLLNLNWDESVPIDIDTKFKEFLCELPLLNNLQISRQIIINNNVVRHELHGFYDASQLAYGAGIYLRSTNDNKIYHNKLICAKNKIAPTKVIFIPRLELGSGLLLARLIKRVRESLNTYTYKLLYC